MDHPATGIERAGGASRQRTLHQANGEAPPKLDDLRVAAEPQSVPHGVRASAANGGGGSWVKQEPAHSNEAVSGPHGVARERARSSPADAASFGRVNGTRNGLVRQSQVRLEDPVVRNRTPPGSQLTLQNPAIGGRQEDVQSSGGDPG